jgi:hypothetical protein
MADTHVAADRDMMYIGLHAHKNLLLDRCTALQTLDACLQFLLPVVTILANPQPSFILASLDLQSRCELAMWVMKDQKSKGEEIFLLSDPTYCFVHLLLLLNETLVVISSIGDPGGFL